METRFKFLNEIEGLEDFTNYAVDTLGNVWSFKNNKQKMMLNNLYKVNIYFDFLMDDLSFFLLRYQTLNCFVRNTRIKRILSEQMSPNSFCKVSVFDVVTN